MGQIQNALNQMFASSIGVGLAMSHSPYVKGQRAIKEFDAPIAEAGETEKVYREDFLGGLQGKIEGAETLKELEQLGKQIDPLVEDYQKTVQAEQDLYKQKEDTILRQGTSKQKKEVLADRASKVIENSPYGIQTPSYDEKAIGALRDAYETKRGVLMSATQRRNMAKSQLPVELL